MQDQINFERIAAAIGYIHEHFREQPTLDQIAHAVNLSPFHFQRLFTKWAGTSPKKFLQYITVEHAKKVLEKNNPSLFDAAIEAGLSGTGRLHDLFITIEGMTPGEYKNGGKHLTITRSFTESLFGEALVATTGRGICYIAFADDRAAATDELKSRFPNATFLDADNSQENPLDNPIHKKALEVVAGETRQTGQTTQANPAEEINLHLLGTPFQLRVWEALLKIPVGQLTTYGAIASHLGNPNASRAVGSAVGRNPVAWLIPCHRVIRSTGVLGDYHWGSIRKSAMIGREAVTLNQNHE